MRREGWEISKESVDKLFPKDGIDTKMDIDILGYESPIEIVMGQMRMEQENGIYRAVQEQGVFVDKDELLKALRYDRDQYNRGYINGYLAKASEVAREIFAEIEKKVKSALVIYFEEMNKEHIKDTPLYDRCSGSVFAFRNMQDFLAELKKKYTEDSNEEQ